MSHKCAEPGCGFNLPDGYPIDRCPWHAAPGKGATKLAVAAGILAAGALGVGGMFAFQKLRDVVKSRKTAAQQDEWIKKAEEMRTAKDSPSENPNQQMRDGKDEQKQRTA